MSRSWLACSPQGYLHLELGCAPARGVLPICSSPPLGTLEAHGEVHAWQPRSVSPRPLSPSIAPPRGQAPVPGSGFPLATGGGRAGTGAPGQDQDEPGTPSLCWVPHFSPPPFFFYFCTRGDPPAAPGCVSAGLSRAGGAAARPALLPPGWATCWGLLGGGRLLQPHANKPLPRQGGYWWGPWQLGDAVVQLPATSQSCPIEFCRGQEVQRFTRSPARAAHIRPTCTQRVCAMNESAQRRLRAQHEHTFLMQDGRVQKAEKCWAASQPRGRSLGP